MTIKVNIVIPICLFLSACSLVSTGYVNEHKQYVPKRSNFKLKDKPDNILPKALDTINVYKLSELYSKNYQEFPVSNSNYKYAKPGFDIGFHYTKFYSNGRCLSFSISSKDSFGNITKLKNANLNPDNPHYSKCYWYCSDGINIKVENFVYAEGDGRYIISNYHLSAQGDTLELKAKNEQIIYIKESLPKNWIQYQANW